MKTSLLGGALAAGWFLPGLYGAIGWYLFHPLHPDKVASGAHRSRLRLRCWFLSGPWLRV